MRYQISVATACLALLSFAPAAPAATMISDHFTRISGPEDIIAPFTDSNGVASTASYSGSVEVLVSGTGFSLFSIINDAFYFNDGTQSGDGYYRLGIGTSAEPLAPFNSSRGAARLISFINGVGFVPANTMPAHDNVNHTYNFVIDLGALTTPLSFGVLNGNFSDNGGAYNVRLWQLEAGAGNAVPEPATWAMLIVGFSLVGWAARRRPAPRAERAA
jgi:hypothetical protein